MKCRIHIGKRPETVIFLCEESGETCRPWQKAGFSTICVDIARDGQDVRLIRAPRVNVPLFARKTRVRSRK